LKRNLIGKVHIKESEEKMNKSEELTEDKKSGGQAS